MDFIIRNKLTIIGIAIGAIGGYLYFHFIGCYSGSCLISSQPVNSTAYGAALGGLVLNMFQGKKPAQNKENDGDLPMS